MIASPHYTLIDFNNILVCNQLVNVVAGTHPLLSSSAVIFKSQTWNQTGIQSLNGLKVIQTKDEITSCSPSYT